MKLEVIPILNLLVRTHQPDNWHSVLCPQIIQTLPKAKMVKIAVAGGSGRK
jgi:hypothetical protein